MSYLVYPVCQLGILTHSLLQQPYAVRETGFVAAKQSRRLSNGNPQPFSAEICRN